MKLAVVISCLVVACHGACEQQRRFPDDFLFGVATAAYQIEGRGEHDGKGESIWDHVIRTRPEVIQDGSNADVAADSYHQYKRDVEMMRELGVGAYRFALSWARILPDGFDNNINEAGVTFYNNYINEMLKYNITPVVTLYHFDLPQKLQDLGGFANPLVADWFEDFARVAFEKFGDRVKIWMTFNEPKQVCEGISGTKKAPMLNSTGIGDYICMKNVMIAHAKAYHLYNNTFKADQKGECGIIVSARWVIPATNSKEDVMGAELSKQAGWTLYTDPIYSKTGGFPKELTEVVAKKSVEQGYSRSRMPTFTDDERKFVQGTSDFLGVNHYTGYYVSTKNVSRKVVPSLEDDLNVATFMPEEWLPSASYWLKHAPNSLYHVLTEISKRYDDKPAFYITENGWSTTAGLNDDGRVGYIRANLNNCLDALEAGVNLKGYMAWSLMDNFEWTMGYKARFGLYEVDHESPNRTRTPRKSAFVYKHIIKHRVIDSEYEPDMTVMTIDEGH